MTFLEPVAGVIAGALGVAGVLLLYALKLRRLPLQISSTLLWRRAVRDLHANVPFRRLRASWLLLVHLAIVLLIAGAIGRPTIGGGQVSGGLVVIAIDVSASMSAVDGQASPDVDAGMPVTRFDEARWRTAALIRGLTRSGTTRCAIVSFGSTARQLTGFTDDRAALLDGLRLAEPTDGVVDSGALVALLSGLVGDSEETRTIVVVTDENMDVAPVQGIGDLLTIRCGGPLAAPSGNIGFVALAARRDEERVDVVRVFAHLRSTFEGEKTVVIVARVDDDVVATGEVTLAGGGDEPASSTIELEIENTSGGVLTLSHATRDLLAADDRVGVVLAGPSDASVLVVAPSLEDADPFLLRVLEALAPDSVEVMASTVYSARMSSADGVGATGGFDADLVIFDRVSPDQVAGVPTMSIGGELAGGQSGVRLGPSGARTRAVWWDRGHPLLRYVNLDTLVVADPLTVVMPADPGLWRFSVLVRGRAGPLALLCERGGGDGVGGSERHVLLAFELMRTNWGPDPSFVVFFKNALDYLTLREARLSGRSFTTGPGGGASGMGDGAGGGAVRVRRAPPPPSSPSSPSVPVRVDGPGGSFVAGDVAGGSGEVSLGMLERAGVYEISGVVPSDSRIVVNLLSPRESAVAGYAAASDAPRSEVGADVVRAPGRNGVRLEEPAEIWHWFVMAALLLLTFEWFAYAWMMRA